MNKPKNSILLLIILLIAVSLACSLGRRGGPLLGEVYQSDEGGFVIHKVSGYSFEDTQGMISMLAPNAIPDVGPEILAIGGIVSEDFTVEDLYDDIRWGDSTIIVGRGKKAAAGGVDGLLADLSGEFEGEAVEGAMFLAIPRPGQQFLLMGLAPEGRWKELQPIFDELLKTVEFIEAAPIEAFEDLLETVEDVEDEVVQEPVTVVEPQVIRQWAVSAEASSEYTSTDWSAMRATGAPAVDGCADDVNAWASLRGDTEEYLVLYYETPVNPTELVIYQNLNPSQVVEVQFIDTTGETWVLWVGEPEEVDCPDVWTHTIELDEVFFTDTVVIFVDQSIMGWGWAEIDAVELVGFPLGTGVAQPDIPGETDPGAEDDPVTEDEPTQEPVDAGDIPSNYEGKMAGPVYQGWVNIIIGETMEADLDRIMTIDGRESTDSWKPRESHAQTYIYELPWDGMRGFISVTTDGWVYKKNVTSTAHPDDFGLMTVNRETYEVLKEIYDRDKVIPYAVMANMLESPGFLREQYYREDDGKIVSTYNWYNADGDRMVGIFFDGQLTGMIGLNFITAP